MATKSPTYEQLLRYPRFLHPTTGVRMPNDNDWQDRHVAAIGRPNAKERAIVYILVGWAAYADQHRAAYESKVGDDGVLGAAWADLGRAIRGLLDGETGRLDCGTLSSFVHLALTCEGVES